MSDDRLPVQAQPPISEEVRQRGIDVLQGLLTNGQVDLARFQTALDGLLGAQSHADFASVVRGLPPPVKFTAPERRRQEPLEITTSMGEIRLDGRWQVGRLTKIHTNMGMVTIDLTEAEFDDWEVEIDVHTNMGSITVIAPGGLDVRQVGKSSAVKSTLEEPIPGFPVVRVSASSDIGTVSMKHPNDNNAGPPGMASPTQRLMAQLATARLVLRQRCEADLDPFAALNADAEVMRYFPARLSGSQSDELAARIQATIARQGWGLWAVEIVQGPPFIGFVGLNRTGFEAHFTPAVEVGWRLDRRHWGNGYATEAAAAALTFGFDHLGCEEIVSFTAAANQRSLQVMRRLGMRGCPADDFDHPAVADRHLRRHLLFRIRRQAWRARRARTRTLVSVA